MKIEEGAFVLSKSEIRAIVESAGSEGSLFGYVFFDASYSEPRVYATDGVKNFAMFGDRSTYKTEPFLVDAKQLKQVASSVTSDGSLAVNPFEGQMVVRTKYGYPESTTGFDAKSPGSWLRDTRFSYVAGDPDGSKKKTDLGILRFDGHLFNTSEVMGKIASKSATVVFLSPGLNDGESSTILFRALNPEGGFCSVSFDVQANIPSRDWNSVSGDPRIGGLGQIASESQARKRIEPKASPRASAPRSPRPSRREDVTHQPDVAWRCDMLDLLNARRYEEAAKAKMAMTGVVISQEDIDLLYRLEHAGLVQESADLRAALFLE